MDWEKVRSHVNKYCHLRDMQYVAYELYARKHGLTARELFVVDIVWFSSDGCRQSAICERTSATKQTISAIIKKFWKLGYMSLSETEVDRRNKIIRLTDAGKDYVGTIIPPAANAEIEAMAELNDEDIVALVRITALFSEQMRRKLDEIGGADIGVL